MSTKNAIASKKSVEKKTARGKNPAGKSPKKTTAKKKAVKKKPMMQSPINDEQRDDMIRVAAYYIAEKECFSGNSFDHWLQAEDEISAQLTLR